MNTGKILLLLCLVILGKGDLLGAQELIVNPSFVLAIDSEKERLVFEKLGLNDKALLQPKDEKEIKILQEKIQALAQYDFYKISHWYRAEEGKEASITVGQQGKEHQGFFEFELKNHRQYVYTHLTQVLERGASYKVRICYNFVDVPQRSDFEQAGIFFAKQAKEFDKRKKAVFSLDFLSDKAQKEQALKQERIVEEYQRNYGGLFEEDFALSEKKEPFFCQELIYKAKGSEMFIAIGRMKGNESGQEKVLFRIYSVSLLRMESTRE